VVHRFCGESRWALAHDVRATVVRVVILAAATVLVAPVSNAAAAPGATPEPRPQGLWRSYPLDPSGSDRTAPVKPAHATPPAAAADDSRREGGSTTLLMVFVLGSAALVAAFTAFAVRWRDTLAGSSRREHGSRNRRRSHGTEGGLTMANQRRRLLGRTASDDPEVSEEPPVEGSYASPPERIADYAGGEDAARNVSAAAPEDAVETRGSDLGNVGAEVEAVLASAQEAAARIRATAETEAERFRSEAEEYAEDTRSSAEEAAQEMRADAERRAAEIDEDAQKRLAEADAEAERKLREAEGTARDRVELLRAATERHEARLESMLAVFRGVSSELEELLGARDDTGEPATAEDDIEERLRLNVVRSNRD
jgi:vacuolar-type H+-ATPase subunit E/Vma4